MIVIVKFSGVPCLFLSIANDQYEEFRQYPVICPNKCVSTKIPRSSLRFYFNEIISEGKSTLMGEIQLLSSSVAPCIKSLKIV